MGIISKFKRVLRKEKVKEMSSELIERFDDRDLYKTNDGNFFFLDKSKYIDKCIIEKGVFEASSTSVVKKLIKEGDVVFDVGANIGYYSVVFSKIVGNSGFVYSFEPTERYFKILEKNISVNKLSNVKMFKFGLSDKESSEEIYFESCSATTSPVRRDYDSPPEIIILKDLDSFVNDNNIKKIDFVKIDIDGHEPRFLRGAEKTIKRFSPIILIEVAHLYYLKAGTTGWDFYNYLKRQGFYIYNEDNIEEIASLDDFLIKCCNFNHSTNILLSLNKILI